MPELYPYLWASIKRRERNEMFMYILFRKVKHFVRPEDLQDQIGLSKMHIG